MKHCNLVLGRLRMTRPGRWWKLCRKYRSLPLGRHHGAHVVGRSSKLELSVKRVILGKQRPVGNSEAEVRKKCAGLPVYREEVEWERQGLRSACYTKVECFGWHVLEGLWDRVAAVVALWDSNIRCPNVEAPQ